MIFENKKAIMGIGTLIIFIATILVAAVAAAVLISTSNVLQQRSLLVGQEARKAITNAVEVVSIMATSDAQTEEFNNFELLVRLSPGSDPIQMRKFNIEYISPTFDDGASLLYSENLTGLQLGQITNSTNTTVYDMDSDGTDELVKISVDAVGTYEALVFYLSDEQAWSDPVSLGENLNDSATTNVSINILESPVIYNESIYAYVSVIGDSNVDNTIPATVNVTVTEVPSECTFTNLPPESKYCYQVVNGNDDFVLNTGERFKLLYKLKDSNDLGIGEDFQFIFTSEKGRLSEARARTPDVVVSTKTKLWPLG